MKNSTICHGLFLVAHDPGTGRLLVDRARLHRALTAGAMAGLLVSGRVTVADGRVSVVDRRVRGGDDPVSATVLGSLAHRRTPLPVDTWADTLGETVHGMVAGELVGSGVLRREAGRRMLLRGGERYPAEDTERAAAPRLELRHMVHSPRAFDLPGAVAVAVLLRLGMDDVLGTERAGVASVLLGDLLDHVPQDLRALVAGLDPHAPVPTAGGGAWTEGRFAGSRFLVEAAVLDRRTDDGSGVLTIGPFDDGTDPGPSRSGSAEPDAEQVRIEQIARTDAIAVLQARNDVATRLLATRGATDSIPLLEELAFDCANLLGPRHPDTLVAEGNLAVAYLMARRLDVGMPLLLSNLTEREIVFGDAHPTTLTARDAVATAYRDSGRLIESLTMAQLVVAQRTHILGGGHVDTLASRLGLGLTHAENGDHATAAGVLGPAVREAISALGPTHPLTLTLRGALADSHLVIGRVDRAREGYRQALSDAELTLGAHHPDVVALRADLEALPAGAGGQVAGV